MLQNPHKTLGFKKNMVYKIPPGGGGKPYPASGLIVFFLIFSNICYRYTLELPLLGKMCTNNLCLSINEFFTISLFTQILNHFHLFKEMSI